MSMYRIARKLLFQLDAERAHELSLHAFKTAPRLATMPFAGQSVSDPFEWKGIRFGNRVGLAAGLDKNGECLEAWSRLGFGFVEVGTVTPRAQPGNPRPRMFRLPEEGALINRLGFNNKGVDHLLQAVSRSHFGGVLGINIGKNADTPIERAEDDYLACLRKVHAHADYVTVNISSPNTRNLRQLQSADPLRALLSALRQEREVLSQAQGRRAPMLVKIAPDMDDTQLQQMAEIALEQAVDGIIATNTTITRPLPPGQALAEEAGGLSGAPLKPLADGILPRLRKVVGKDLLLVGVGGVSSAEDALDKRRLGADVVQIYSGFIYHGPSLVRQCAQALAGDTNR